MRRAVGNIPSSPMVQNELQLDGVVKLDEVDAYRETSRILAQIREAQSRLDDCRRQIEESDTYDADYKNFLLFILSNQECIVVPGNKRKERGGACELYDDCYDEEENDPQYEDVLKCLTEHGKSYVLKYEENGLPVVIKYEEVHSDEECDLEPRRKLRSAMKEKVDCSDQMSGRGDQDKRDPQSTKTKKLTGRISRNKSFSQDREDAKYSAKEMVAAPDYLTSSQTTQVVDEGNASLYKTCDSQPKTRLWSAMKQKIGSSNGMPHLDNQCMLDLPSTNKTENLTRRKTRNMAMTGSVQSGKCTTTEMVSDPDYLVFLQNLQVNLTGRKSRNMATSGRVQNEKHKTTEMVSDPDYLVFLQNTEFINDSYVCTYGSLRIVYESKEDGMHNQVKENHDEEFLSDVQIIDRALFYNTVNEKNILNIDPTISDFRQQLINVLKKPYDKEEHRRLWQDIRLRKPQGRHLDLRNGRERTCAKNTDGKSYLDYGTGDLKKELSKYKNDKPKHLNILRGFFFWLENCPSDSSFLPWADEKCLGIRPESC